MALLIIIAIVTLFVGFCLWLDLDFQRIQGHQLQTLADSPCPACSTRYGADAAERARQKYLTGCAEARRKHPNARIHFVSYWEICCPQCGSGARFHYETETLAAQAAKPPLTPEV